MARILTLTLNPALDLTVSLATLQPGAVNRSHAQHSHSGQCAITAGPATTACPTCTATSLTRIGTGAACGAGSSTASSATGNSSHSR